MTKLRDSSSALVAMVLLSEGVPLSPSNAGELWRLRELGWVARDEFELTAAGFDALGAALAEGAAALNYRSTWTPIR